MARPAWGLYSHRTSSSIDAVLQWYGRYGRYGRYVGSLVSKEAKVDTVDMVDKYFPDKEAKVDSIGSLHAL